MDTANQTARAGGRASTTIFLWLYWCDTPPVQSDQLSSFGADMTSATSLSLSMCNLLLYGNTQKILINNRIFTILAYKKLTKNFVEAIFIILFYK